MRHRHEELLDAAIRAQREIMQAMRAATDPAWMQLDLTMGQLKALFALADDALTVGQIATLLGIGQPAASTLVERLVQLGMVTRSEDAADRRRTLVRLTPAGAEMASKLRQGGQDRFRALLSHLGDDDLAALVQGLQALAAIANAPADQADQVATPA